MSNFGIKHTLTIWYWLDKKMLKISEVSVTQSTDKSVWIKEVNRVPVRVCREGDDHFVSPSRPAVEAMRYDLAANCLRNSQEAVAAEAEKQEAMKEILAEQVVEVNLCGGTRLRMSAIRCRSLMKILDNCEVWMPEPYCGWQSGASVMAKVSNVHNEQNKKD